MADYAFYHLQNTPLERALPKLMERVLAAGRRAVVVAGSAERIAALDASLWTYEPDSFLPHGAAPGTDADLQPIWLTTVLENPNSADVLALVDGVKVADLDGFSRCLDLFDGNDDEAVAAARRRWRDAKAAGHAVTYWAQNEEGRWEQRA